MSESRELEELLESDDELPNTYDEISDIPAYQDDERFEPIKFPWINYYKPEQKQPPPPRLSYLDEEKRNALKNLKQNETIMIMRGYLSQQDLLCVKSLEEMCNDDTLLWFIHFLILKDIQSNYKYRTSCLVTDLSDEYKEHNHLNNADSDQIDSDQTDSDQTDPEMKNFNFRVILK